MEIDITKIVNLPNIAISDTITNDDVSRISELWERNNDIIQKLAIEFITPKIKELLKDENQDTRVAIKTIIEFLNKFASYSEKEQE